MESQNKNQELDNNPKTKKEEEITLKPKSEQLDLKKLITKIDNRVKTKVSHINKFP